MTPQTTRITSYQTDSRTGLALANEWGMEWRDLAGFKADSQLLTLFPAPLLFRHKVLPLVRDGRRLRVATADPMNIAFIDELTAIGGCTVDCCLADPALIEQHLRDCFGVGGGTVEDLVAANLDQAGLNQAIDDEAIRPDETASVIKLVNELLQEAVRQGASDIHVEPDRDQLDVRFRVDGLLRTQPMPGELHRFRAAITSRLKIMARLNIAERRVPQDGRFRIQIEGHEIDVRVSVIPMHGGEGIVLRLLDRSRMTLDLNDLQLPTLVGQRWQKVIERPHGMVLVTGPTGSGKTTTLYASIQSINTRDKKIVTIEDPVEYQLRGINQIQVHDQVGLTFASGLRSVLRHDPDVVLIGEIRDQETAVACIQASLTGHLVLSTLHTNDAPSAIVRLADMGVERYLISSTIHGVLAQRLLRRLCSECKRRATNTTLETLPKCLAHGHVFEPVGCRTCGYTGYRGRFAIYEYMAIDQAMRQCITNGDSVDVLRDAAIERGMIPLQAAGWERVAAGDTSIDEVLRVTVNDC